MIRNTNIISELELSANYFSFEVSGGISTLFSHVGTLKLGSCNIQRFPDFLINSTNLAVLDLSNNKIRGAILNWIWKLGNGNLIELNLSANFLSGFEKPGPNLSSSQLAVLDLRSNFLQGPFPLPPPLIVFLDYSNNKFSSTLAPSIFDGLYYAIFFSLSSNYFRGEVPLSVCGRTYYLEVLDLSNNQLNGSIPPCLGSHQSLIVLNLGNNRLLGELPPTYGKECNLRTVDVSQNYLGGPLPRSLAKCGNLEVLDIGNNNLSGSFPFWLGNMPKLRILIFRSNHFGGSIANLERKNAFPSLQIIDMSSNHFHGSLPSEWFRSLQGMMKQKKETQSCQVLRFGYLELSGMYYQDSVSLMNKGIYINLEKILTIFISIDLSNNQFEGEIPETIGELQSLYVLNLSRNHFKGQIPSSFGQLKELGSLDLSNNNLSGKIPQELTYLTFLSFPNLSQNSLVGEIPRGNQLDTFTAASFETNIGLCGFQLSKACHNGLPASPPNANPESSFKPTCGIDLNFYWIGFGCGGGIGINIGFIAGNVIVNVILKRRRSRVRVNRRRRVRRVHNFHH